MNIEFFQERYPEDYPKTVDVNQYSSVIEIFNEFVKKFADKPAFTCLGQSMTYRELDEKSAAVHIAPYSVEANASYCVQ